MSRFIRFSYFIFLGVCEMNLNKFAGGDCSWQESGMFYSASWGDKRGSVIMIAIGHASILSLPRARNAILSPGARGSLTSAIDRARGNSRRRSLFPSSSAGWQAQSWCTNCAWTVLSPFSFSTLFCALLNSLSVLVSSFLLHSIVNVLLCFRVIIFNYNFTWNKIKYKKRK